VRLQGEILRALRSALNVVDAARCSLILWHLARCGAM